jgi:hypothetical protein
LVSQYSSRSRSFIEAILNSIIPVNLATKAKITFRLNVAIGHYEFFMDLIPPVGLITRCLYRIKNLRSDTPSVCCGVIHFCPFLSP